MIIVYLILWILTLDLPAGSIDLIFQRLDIFDGSNVLEQIDQNGALCFLLLDSQVHPIDRAYQWYLLFIINKGQIATVGTQTCAVIILSFVDGHKFLNLRIILQLFWVV